MWYIAVMRILKAIGFIGLVTCLVCGTVLSEPEPIGGLVLQFDDGWQTWRTELAPVLAAIGGKATAFVNNRYLVSGRITLEDLRVLQSEFGWEIGSHTYNHRVAPRFVRQNGVDVWLEQELKASVEELQQAGLDIQGLAFPYNDSTPVLEQAARGVIRYFRRRERFPLAPGIREDGSFPSVSMDTVEFIPFEVWKRWVDLAAERGQVLFVYGHRVLPDETFVTGTVMGVFGDTVELDTIVRCEPGDEYVLVLDGPQTAGEKRTYRVAGCDGKRVRLLPEVKATNVKPGSTFLLGPSYGTRRSDFLAFVHYASSRLKFYTLREIYERERPRTDISP